MTELEADYRQRYESVLVPLAQRLQARIQTVFGDAGIQRIDRISARAKSPARFLAKAAKSTESGKLKYTDPMSEIQDQVGARIITLYESEVSKLEEIITTHFRPIEQQRIVPESAWTFGYFGKHFLLLFPTDILPDGVGDDELPVCFELQIKTLFQHAWSEANHDLGYKPEMGELTGDEQRQLAFTSAQAWGADQQFDALFRARSSKVHGTPTD